MTSLLSAIFSAPLIQTPQHGTHHGEALVEARKSTALCRLYAAGADSQALHAHIERAKRAGATIDEVTQVVLASWQSTSAV
ncbi:MAG: hypothetical protein QOG53_3128 [Frankiales bacterium]|jgi:outer membrane PBP1 activator LpoA protein|nr:hypothetical protein [Frankiales bacterium]